MQPQDRRFPESGSQLFETVKRDKYCMLDNCRQVMVLLEPHSSTSFGKALEYDVLSSPLGRAHLVGAQALKVVIILRSVDRKIDTTVCLARESGSLTSSCQ